MPINVNGFSCILAGGVRETSNTTGTGNYTLNGAATIEGITYRTFAAGIGDGNRTVYRAQLGSEFEHGIGTITAPSTLSRDSILASSNGGNAVNWGTTDPKDIWCDAAAAIFHSIQTKHDSLDTDILGLRTWHVGETAPSPSYANQRWYQPSINRVWLRNNANTAWLPWLSINQTTGTWTIDLDADDVDVLSLHGSGGQRILFRMDGSGNGKIVVYDSAGVAKAAMVGSGGGRIFTGGDESTGNQIGATQESSELSITDLSLTNAPHGLGQRPRKIWGVWRCKTTEFGYAVDDEILITQYFQVDTGVGSGPGVGALVGADATNVFLITANSPVQVLNSKSSPANFAVGTNANWRAVLRWEL